MEPLLAAAMRWVMETFVINGRFAARRLTGQERVALELLHALDKIVEPGRFTVVCPTYAELSPLRDLQNIAVVSYGKVKGHFWEQFDLSRYLRKNGGVSVNLCTTVPLTRPGYVFIHDLAYRLRPDFFHKTVYAFASMWWHRLHHFVCAKRARLIFTVSEYSKKQICEVYHLPPERVEVVGCAWQHFERIEADDAIFEQYPQLRERSYYFSLGSLAQNKNIDWLLTAARRNPDALFVISGNFFKKGTGVDYAASKPDNVLFTGYLSDGAVKSLMRGAKAFLFPSRYEGFGIPPLEALSVGTPICVSAVTCLPEIYGDAAHYIDPDDPTVDLDALLREPVADPSAVLAKYSWDGSAKKLLAALTTCEEGRA